MVNAAYVGFGSIAGTRSWPSFPGLSSAGRCPTTTTAAPTDCSRRDPAGRCRAPAAFTRRLCTIAGLCKYAVEEELLEHSAAAHVRRPRVGYEAHAVMLDRNELGALLVVAGLGWLDALTRSAEGSPWIRATG